MSYLTDKQGFRHFLQEVAGHELSEETLNDLVEQAFPKTQLLFVTPFPPALERAISGEHLYFE